jgi:hypothetical protein
MRGRIVLAGIGALVALGVLLLLAQLGVPFAFALSWLIILLTIAVATRQGFLDETGAWPPPEREREVRSSQVSRLAWSINIRTGVAGHVVVRRVQNVLRRRLAHLGLDVDDPLQHATIDAMLGAGLRESLHRREVQRADIERVLDAMDRLSHEREENP